MPHLAVDVTGPLAPADKRGFAADLTEGYAAEMATGTDHVAVTVREREPAEIHLGRAVAGRRLVLDADVSRGRSAERRRAFALLAIEAAGERFGVPEPNAKVTFTEHAGPELTGADRVGGAWSPEGADDGDDGEG